MFSGSDVQVLASKGQAAGPTAGASIPPTPERIMYLISDLSIGGAELSLYRLLARIDRQRFEPVVLSLVNRGSLRRRLKDLGVEVHTVNVKSERPSVPDLFRLVRLIKRLQPKIIVGWMYHSCLAAELATRFTGDRIPTIWSLHCAINAATVEKRRTVLVARLCGILSGLPSKIVLVSHAARRQLESLRFQLQNSCVIPNGIEVERFAPSKDAKDAMRKDLGLGDDALLIGLVGRYHPAKDHQNFLRAAASVAKTNPNAHFVLVGRGVDKTNQELVGLIAQLQISERVHMLGEREDTPELMAAFDLFALSSVDESCPNVIGEAMACGVPCVVTDVGDAALIVGATGRVVPPRDPNALASGLKELINLGAAGRNALGMNARARVVELFAIDHVARQHESLYETVLLGKLPNQFDVAAKELSPGWHTSLVHGSDNL